MVWPTLGSRTAKEQEQEQDNKDMIVTDTESRKTTDNGGKTIMFPEDGDMVNDGQPITSYWRSALIMAWFVSY